MENINNKNDHYIFNKTDTSNKAELTSAKDIKVDGDFVTEIITRMRENTKFNEDTINQIIHENCVNIFSNCAIAYNSNKSSNEKDQTKSTISVSQKTGILIGKVQSGKT